MLNKDNFTRKFASETGRTITESKQIVEDFIATITKSVVEDGGVDFYGFMKIERVTQPARERVNPATGDKIMCEEKEIPKAKFSSRFKKIVNGEA